MIKVIPALFLLSALLLNGCVSLNEKKISPEMPVELHPAAAELKGVAPVQLYVESQLTIPDMALRARTIQRVAEVAQPAVVSIYVRTKTPMKVRLLPIRFSFTGIPVKLPGVGLGSGFFIHPGGYILSNEHVIRNASEIRVMTQNGTDYVARVIAVDPVYDLALLKVDSPNKIPFAFLPMGNSSEISGGDHVIAIGNPLGFGHTVTAGIISHTGRSLFEVQDANGRYVHFLQTDVAINPGSSGGPLITLAGSWVGLNSAQIENTQGIGLTVPSRQVKEFLGNVLEGKGQTVE